MFFERLENVEKWIKSPESSLPRGRITREGQKWLASFFERRAADVKATPPTFEWAIRRTGLLRRLSEI
jgi:hypothetical protein